MPVNALSMSYETAWAEKYFMVAAFLDIDTFYSPQVVRSDD